MADMWERVTLGFYKPSRKWNRLRVKDQASHPCKTTCKINVFIKGCKVKDYWKETVLRSSLHFREFAILILLSRDPAPKNLPTRINVKTFPAIHFCKLWIAFNPCALYHVVPHAAHFYYSGNFSQGLEHSFRISRSQISPRVKMSDCCKQKRGNSKGSQES